MESMVEKVARSLFLAEHPGSEWSAGRARVKWFYMAEAAIQAMREPTAGMATAGFFAVPFDEVFDGQPYKRADSARFVWQAMIDAALPHEGR